MCILLLSEVLIEDLESAGEMDLLLRAATVLTCRGVLIVFSSLLHSWSPQQQLSDDAQSCCIERGVYESKSSPQLSQYKSVEGMTAWAFLLGSDGSSVLGFLAVLYLVSRLIA